MTMRRARSKRGELAEEANELRGPYVFEDDDGQK